MEILIHVLIFDRVYTNLKIHVIIYKIFVYYINVLLFQVRIPCT